MKSICLAILNYNGRKHLQHLLPTAIVAAKNYQGSCSVLILDNRSTDPDVEWCRRKFPSVQVVVAPENDFLFSYNWFAGKCETDIIVFLNNDLKLHSDFVWPLAQHFNHDDVFAVTATSRDWDDQIFTCGPARLKSHHGVYHWDYQRERQELCHTLFCSGGFMAVDRRKFLELGGFNRLFWPAYSEDLDLCFRSWRSGWRCIFEPASIVWHRENGTWGGNAGGRADRLMLRTSLLFRWSSLPSTAGWPERTAFVCLTAFRMIFKGQSWWLKTWIKTWLEWQRLKKNCQSMKTSPHELETMLAKMEEDVYLPAK